MLSIDDKFKVTNPIDPVSNYYNEQIFTVEKSVKKSGRIIYRPKELNLMFFFEVEITPIRHSKLSKHYAI